MIICVGYDVGESREAKYFESFEDVIKFINKSLDVLGGEYFNYDLAVMIGKEEERVRKQVKLFGAKE